MAIVPLPANPVLPGTYPDPSICRVGGDYYLVTSTFEYFPGLPIFHSTDLEHWHQLGHVVDRDGQLDLSTVESSEGLFAPTIRHDGERFFITCTLVGGSGRQGNFVMTAVDATGPWSDPHWLDDAEGIDPSLFFDDDGRAWYTGTHLTESPDWPSQTSVWLRELDRSTLRLTGEKHVLWHGALLGAVWAEGPHLFKRNGWYYLLASEGGTEFAHALSVARSRDVTGPYLGFEANPVLTHRNLGHRHPVTDVGHADLVETPDGAWAAVLLAARPYGGYHANLGRETFMVGVEWEDDWPIFAPGVGQVTAAAPADEPGYAVPDHLDWTSLRGSSAGFATVEGDGVTLRASPLGLDEVGTPAFAGIRQRHRDAFFTATIGHTSSRAGIVVRQSEGVHLFFARTGDVVTLSRSGAIIAEFAIVGDATLTLTTAGQDYSFTVDSDTGSDARTVDGRFLSSQSSGGFLGVWFGLAAVGEPGPVTFTDVLYGGR